MNIIEFSSLNTLKEFVQKEQKEYPFILAGNQHDFENSALDKCRLRQIDLYSLSADEQRLFEQEYINSIAKLHSICDPLAWWSNSLSEKNEYLSPLYTSICFYYRLIRTLQHCREDCVLVMCNQSIGKQLREYCYRLGYEFVSIEGFSWKETIFKFLSYLKRLTLFMIRGCMQTTLVSLTLTKKISRQLRNIHRGYVIRTWVNANSCSKWEEQKDTFFGRLPWYLKNQGHDTILVVGISGDFKAVLNCLKKWSLFPAIPEDYFISCIDYIRVILWASRNKIKLHKDVLIQGIVVTCLYQDEIKRGYRDLVTHQAFLRYLIGIRCTRLLPMKVYLQTFENLAWEKLMILGLRKGSISKPRPVIVGFQHAYISRNSFKFFVGEEERDYIPLPDKIITMGKVTKRILEQYGAYPEGLIVTGCALRQDYIHRTKLSSRKHSRNIMIPLTMVFQESVAILKFLYKSEISRIVNYVIIRPHPFLPILSLNDDFNLELPKNFIIDNDNNVEETLDRVDCVVYMRSTVAIEALKKGIPVIYLNLLHPLYVDPLFECVHLKYTINHPDELPPTVKGLYEIRDETFMFEQLMAQKYLDEYFVPVNANNLSVFVG